MPADAEAQEEGEWTVFWLTIASAAACFAAIIGQYAAIKNLPAGSRSPHVVLVAATLLLSWLVTQTLFALRYAHEYYTGDYSDELFTVAPDGAGGTDLVVSGTSRGPESFAWVAASGAWSSAANWAAKGGPPTSGDEAMFQNGAGVISGSGNAGTLDFAAGIWSMEGTIAVAGETDVGELGAAVLTIGGGGSLEGAGGATIATAAGTDGSSVSVIGSNSTWALGGQLQVGKVAEGSLTVTSQAAVTVASLEAGVAGGIHGLDPGQWRRQQHHRRRAVHCRRRWRGRVGDHQRRHRDRGRSPTRLPRRRQRQRRHRRRRRPRFFTVTGNAYIGVGGLGVLTVGPGATLDVAGDLNEGAEGVLNIVGGVVDPGNGVLGGNDPIGNDGTLVYTGTLTLTGTISVTGCTGELDVETLTGPGTLAVGEGGNLVLADGAGATAASRRSAAAFRRRSSSLARPGR